MQFYHKLQLQKVAWPPTFNVLYPSGLNRDIIIIWTVSSSLSHTCKLSVEINTQYLNFDYVTGFPRQPHKFPPKFFVQKNVFQRKMLFLILDFSEIKKKISFHFSINPM
jgi:hypothetical protein